MGGLRQEDHRAGVRLRQRPVRMHGHLVRVPLIHRRPLLRVLKVIANWKETAASAYSKGYKYLSTPLVAVDVDYAKKFIEQACDCVSGQCAWGQASRSAGYVFSEWAVPEGQGA